MRWNLALAGLATSWGLIAVLVAAVDLGAEALAFLRLALAGATLALTALVLRRADALRPGGRLAALIALGIVQGAHWLLFFEAIKLGSVALAVLTFYTAPIFLAVFAPLFLPERLSRVALGALVPAGIGIVLIALAGDGGDRASRVGSGSRTRLGGDLRGAADPLEAAAARTNGAADRRVLGLLRRHARSRARALFRRPCAPRGGREWGAVLLLGVVFTGLSTLLYAGLLQHVTAQAAGILTFLEPVAAVLLAWALLDDPVDVSTLVGGALVLAAGIVVVALEPAAGHVAEAVAGVGSAS